MVSDDTLKRFQVIQEELKQSEKRISALELGKVELESEPESRSATPTISDFLSAEELRAIDVQFYESLRRGVDCDPSDYALAAACGVLCGLVDVLFVKAPHEGLLGQKTDELFDSLVTKLAKGKQGSGNTVKSAIGFFERNAKVSYDQATTQSLKVALSDGFSDTVEHLSMKNHHAKSLSHYPDVFGLIASICNQFTNTSTFLDSGRGTITITNGTGNGFELEGGTLLSKLYCGFINWIMHCISDVAGSSGSKGVGTGLPIPVTEFFQFCNFGRFENEKGQWQSFATVMTKVYEEGYDLRHGVTTSIPVLLNDLLIHAIFTIKQHFTAGVPWERIKDNYDVLQRMKTVSIGSLCLVDLSEAAITSWGNWVVFFSHLNISAWLQLGKQGVNELQLLCDREIRNIDRIQDDIEMKWSELLERSKSL